MKSLLLPVTIILLVFVSCTTTNSPVTNIYLADSTAPTITGFSPNTVWTFDTLTIYGTHFGYAFQSIVAIDTAYAEAIYTDDTILKVIVPEYARTGKVHVATINGKGVSSKNVNIEYTFSPHSIVDTLPIGASFSIPGTGMNHSHGILRMYVAGIYYPIDSIFPDRIVSHVVSGALSGNILLYDSSGAHSLGTMIVTRPSKWNTLSIIWDHAVLTESHRRTGYVNGPTNRVDSTWQITSVISAQRDINVTGIPFTVNPTGVNYQIPDPSYYFPTLAIVWDTVTRSASVTYRPHFGFVTPTLTLDTDWYSSTASLPALLPLDNDIEFVMPNYSYSITKDSTDTQGLVNWQETANATLNSGSFDLILKK